MRKIYVLLLLFLPLVFARAYAGVPVKLAESGTSKWRIYTGKGDVAQFAAAELQQYFKQLCGVSLPYTDDENGKYVISIALRGSLHNTKGLAVAKTGFDGYSILVSPKQVIIAGDNDRGILYGVYDLLERLGCRWYQPTLDKNDPEVVPFNKNQQVASGTWAEASPMELRIFNGSAFFFVMDPSQMLPQLDWAAKNRYNGISWQAHHGPGKIASQMDEMKAGGVFTAMDKRGLFLHGPAHSFPYFLQTDKYYADHPEWFGLYKGKRLKHGQEFPLMNYCWSNADANTEFIKNVKEYIHTYPQYKILCLVWIDGGALCGCDNCQKAGAANLIVNLFNRLSDTLARVAPAVTLEAVLGYAPVEAPPKGAVPNGKWQGLYAHWGRNHNQSYADSNYNKKANMEEWAKYFKDNLEICSYYATTSHQPINSPPFLHALEGDMDYLVDNKIKGDLVMQYPHGFWWNFSFNLAEAGIYAYYYPNRKPAPMLKDYAYSYFGPKAGPLLHSYLEKLSNNLEVSYRASRGDASAGEMQWLAETGKLITAAQQAGTDSIYAYRVAKLAASHNVLTHWGNGLQYLKKTKEKAAAYDEGKATRADVTALIEAGRQYAKDLLSYAAVQEAKYPGVTEAEWLRGWYVNRTLLEPLTAIEKKLK